VKSIRRYGSLEALLACLAAAGLGLSACGGQGDVARAPTPSKVAWNNSGDDTGAGAEASSASAEPDEQEDTPVSAPGKSQPPVIDLDAPPSKPRPAREPKALAESTVESEPAKEEEVVEEEEEAPAPAAKPAAPARAEEPDSPASDPLAVELRKRRAQAKARSEAKSEEPPTQKRAAAAAPTKRDYGGSDPCRATSFSVPRVRDACASGGRTAAKRVMKEAIGKATATGQVLKCSNCHANQSDYTLKSNAAADLQRWLGD
jgi:outer membrane biosynthesis protein TonB